jgi:hypothetical protein
MANILQHNVDNADDEDESGKDADYDEQELLNVLAAYYSQAENGRLAGMNPRDEIWRQNWDRYWNRYDDSGKADWQSRHVMPEAPQFIDRWAAAMREALDSGGEWFTAYDDGGVMKDLIPVVNKVMANLLTKISRTHDGHPIDFSSFFEEQMKLGGLMMCCASVTWQNDREAPDGWPRVETVDPREVWYDPKGRGLYRVRRQEMDKWEVEACAKEKDDEDEDVYNVEVIEQLMADENWKLRENRERSTGHDQGDGAATARTPIQIDEWLATVVMPDGTLACTDNLIVVANGRFLIRGPDVNPFSHDRDWIVSCPMISVPMSLYGKSYMENWSEVADAFVELTNVLLDGATTSALRAFVANPSMLENPEDLLEGISPNKIFTTEEDASDVKKFINTIDLGTLPTEAVTVWKVLKEELREGAMLNEIALGQMAPHSRTTATEINRVQQSGSAMVRSIARTIESRFIEIILTLIWKTALQHMDFTVMAPAIGEANAAMLNARRDEFMTAVGFRVRGISGVVDRQQRLQNLLNLLGIISKNEALLAKLLEKVSLDKLLQTLVSLFGIDMNDLKIDAVDATLQNIAETAGAQPQQQAPAPAPVPPWAGLI